MRGLWLVLLLIVVLVLGASLLPRLPALQAPPGASKPEGETGLLEHWLLGPGAVSANVEFREAEADPEGTTGEGDPGARFLFIIGLFNPEFQGLIALDPLGQGRWLRRGSELYYFDPQDQTVVEVPTQEWEASFLGSALTVEEFFFGFRLDRGPYDRLEVDFPPEAPGVLRELRGYRGDQLVKLVRVQEYTQYRRRLLIRRVRVEAPLQGRQTQLIVAKREAHALPSFAFTPETLKGLEVQFKGQGEEN